MTDEENKLSQRFDYLQQYLLASDGWKDFIHDLNTSIASLKHEQNNNLFVIKETATADIKKVQAIGSAMRKVRSTEAEELWSTVGDLIPIALHKQLIQDCDEKLKRDGASRVAKKGVAIKKLRRALKALKDEVTIGSLWLSLPGQSGIELHQQLMADCSDWVSRSDSEEKVRIAFIDTIIGIAISLAEKYFTMNISSGNGSPFMRFTDDLCALFFCIKGRGQSEGEYSRETFRSWLRNYLCKNETISAPQE